MTASYPLEWPSGWPRTEGAARTHHAMFKMTFEAILQKFGWEMDRLRARDWVVSSWLPVNQRGNPRADMARRILDDPGVAVYFTLRGRQMSMARDAHLTVSDNLRSLTLAIEHMRGLERHGGAVMMERAFEGFAALPAPGRNHWRIVLGLAGNGAVTSEQVEEAWRRGAKLLHSDVTGGSDRKMAELNVARDQARRELDGAP